MYVYMHIYIYEYMHIYIYIYICICIHVFIHIYIYIYIYMCLFDKLVYIYFVKGTTHERSSIAAYKQENIRIRTTNHNIQKIINNTKNKKSLDPGGGSRDELLARGTCHIVCIHIVCVCIYIYIYIYYIYI